MVTLPAIPYLPRLHAFHEPGQSTTYLRVFGLVLLIQWFIPYVVSGPYTMWSWDAFGKTVWSLLAGLGFTLIGFLPALSEMVNERLRFIIAFGAGIVGVLWSFASPGFYQLTGFGALGLIALTVGLFLWARNGFSGLARSLTMSGALSLVLGLLLPLNGQMPLAALFNFGPGFWGVTSSLFYLILTLAFIAVLVLIVMNVILPGEKAKPAEVEQYGNLVFTLALLATLIPSLLMGPMMSFGLHQFVIFASFTWLSIWGAICYLEAQARGENLLKP